MLVPELTVTDPDAAGAVLRRLGFSPSRGLWRQGDQALRLVRGAPGGHGRIDHIALSVPDVDKALGDLQAAGVALEPTITPGGPQSIPEFWDHGLRYVYLAGPQGARIELCQRLGEAAGPVGHDHIGIPCQDLAAVQAFFQDQGARLIASVDLLRAEGRIPVRFLQWNGGMIELFRPATPGRVATGLWSRLLVAGLEREMTGPEDLILAPL